MEPWEIIQAGQVLEGVYDKDVILRNLADLPPDRFSRFCREYLHLLNFYESNRNLGVTDHRPIIEQYPAHFSHLPDIDFDAPPPIKVE